MRVILKGKEVRCCTYQDLKVGEVFTVNGLPYLKAQSGHMVRICDGQTENYGGQIIVPYPEAVLVLDPCERECGHQPKEKC